MNTRFNEEGLASLLLSLDPIRFELLRQSVKKYRKIVRSRSAILSFKALEARNKIVREIADACPKESGWTENKIDNVIYLGLLLDIVGRK